MIRTVLTDKTMTFMNEAVVVKLETLVANVSFGKTIRFSSNYSAVSITAHLKKNYKW